MKTGLIVGTGADSLVRSGEWRETNTPYGEAFIADITLGDREVVLMRRHGPGLNVPPHLVNYRANMMALRLAGVTHVLSTAAVGSLRRDLKPGDLAVIEDFIDFTKRRECTIYDTPAEVVHHTDFSVPYCPAVSAAISQASTDLGAEMARGMVYVCVDGPRYETPAETRMFAQWGGDVIGMTGVPEVVIARELGLCYGSMAIVTNYAAGISERPLSHQEVVEMVSDKAGQVYAILERTVASLPEDNHCCSTD